MVGRGNGGPPGSRAGQMGTSVGGDWGGARMPGGKERGVAGSPETGLRVTQSHLVQARSLQKLPSKLPSLAGRTQL